MTAAPIDAVAQLADGQTGEILAVIVNPLNHRVTHIAVRLPKPEDQTPRLVSIEGAKRLDRRTIVLPSTTAQVRACEPFTEEQHRLVSYLDYQQAPIDPTGMLIGPAPTESYYVTDTVARIPAGELAVTTGTQVNARDGQVGHVVDLVVDPDTGEVTHIVVERGGQELTLRLSTIDYVAENAVYLKLDRLALDLLPAVPVRSKRGPWTNAEITLLAIVYDTPDQADDALEFVKKLHQQDSLRLRNAAVLVKTLDGQTTVKERHDLDAKEGAVGGAVLGGILALLTGGIGAVAGAVLGAGAGALAGKVVDRGFSDRLLQALVSRLQPGRSCLLLIVQTEWVLSTKRALAAGSGVVFQQELTDQLVDELTAEQSQAC